MTEDGVRAGQQHQSSAAEGTHGSVGTALRMDARETTQLLCYGLK